MQFLSKKLCLASWAANARHETAPAAKFRGKIPSRPRHSRKGEPRGFISFVRSCAPKPKRYRANSTVATRTRRDFEVIAIRNPFNCYFFLTSSRVVLIFRVRSARKLAIRDSVLLKKLSAMVLLYLSYLTVWMVIQPPSTESGVTTDKLKYKRCTKGWFGHIIIAGKNVSLVWYSKDALPTYELAPHPTPLIV